MRRTRAVPVEKSRVSFRNRFVCRTRPECVLYTSCIVDDKLQLFVGTRISPLCRFNFQTLLSPRLLSESEKPNYRNVFEHVHPPSVVILSSVIPLKHNITHFKYSENTIFFSLINMYSSLGVSNVL